MKKIISILALTTLISTASFSQTQMEMNQSASDDYAKADKKLNRVYGQLTKTFGGTNKAALIEVQKVWIKYRDSHCKFVCMDYEGGSMYRLMYCNCLTGLTENRTKELNALLEGY